MHSLTNLNAHFTGGNLSFPVKLHNSHFQTSHICIYAKFMLSNSALGFLGVCFMLPVHILPVIFHVK